MYVENKPVINIVTKGIMIQVVDSKRMSQLNMFRISYVYTGLKNTLDLQILLL